MRFSVRKVLAIVAVYAIWLGALRSLGNVGIITGLFCATVTSILILVARRSDLPSIALVAIGGLLGALVGAGCLSPVILTGLHGYDYGFGETVRSNFLGGVIGTICGAFLLSLAGRKKKIGDFESGIRQSGLHP